MAEHEDNTRRVEAKKELRQNEELMQLIIKHDPNAMAVFDCNMCYVACSQRFLEDYGLPDNDIIGKCHYELFPEIPDKWRNVHQRALKGETIKNDDDWFERPDGSITYNRWECRPWYTAAHDIGGIILFSEVTTKRKLAEIALKEAKEASDRERKLLDAVFNSMDDMLMVFDMDGAVIFANEAQRAFFNEHVKGDDSQNRESFIQTFRYSDGASRELGLDDTPLALILHGESVRNKDLTLQHRVSGREWTFSVSGSPLYDTEGEQTSALVIMRDVSDAKANAEKERGLQKKMEQTQRLESLGVLAGGIAHDFNNLLMAILGHADLAIHELSPLSPVIEDLNNIKTSSRRAAELCSQLLAYSGKGKLEERSFSMSELVDEMTQLLKTSISKKCVLNLKLEKDLPLTEGDPSQMRQIIMNFVLNASDATGERSGMITIATGAMDCSKEYLANGYVVEPLEPGLYVTLEVSDNGPGMDKDTLGRIFEPFFTTKFSGRGLGLSAVLGIIRSHGGGLRVYSEPGRGSAFKVLLPAIKDELVAPAPAEQQPMPNRMWSGRGTVLLVDDEESVRAICGRQLRKLGLEYLVARDGQEGVEVYLEHQAEIDVVILDLTMPKMSGEEVFRELQRINPDVNVVLSSGYTETDVATRFAGRRICGFLRKPYTIDTLIETLAKVLPGNESA